MDFVERTRFVSTGENFRRDECDRSLGHADKNEHHRRHGRGGWIRAAIDFRHTDLFARANRIAKFAGRRRCPLRRSDDARGPANLGNAVRVAKHEHEQKCGENG